MSHFTRVTSRQSVTLALVALCLIVLTKTVRYDYLAYGSAATAVIVAIVVYLHRQMQERGDLFDWYEEPAPILDWEEFLYGIKAFPDVNQKYAWVFRAYERRHASKTCTQCGKKLQLGYYSHVTIPPHGRFGFRVYCPNCKTESGKIHVLTV